MLARGRLVAALLFVGLLLSAGSAGAKALHDSPYTYEQTFGSALRLLKVDLGVEVTEINSEWGYVLFIYTSSESGKRQNRASFSFVRGKEYVQVAVEIPEMPSYHEQLIIEKLKKKLESEHGSPPPKPKKKDDKKKKKKKGKKDDDDDDGKKDDDDDEDKDKDKDKDDDGDKDKDDDDKKD